MAKKYIKLTTIRCFANTDDQAKSKYGNSNWKPYKDGAPADLHFRSDARYSVQCYENDDGSLGINIAEVQDYVAKDNIADGISQGGFKTAGQAINNQHQPPQRHQPATKPAEGQELDDSDIPF